MFNFFVKKEKPLFKSLESNRIEMTEGTKKTIITGVFPLVDENSEDTPFITIGNKNGIPEVYEYLKKNYGKIFKFIYNCQSGYFLAYKYKFLKKSFDGIYDLDYKERDIKKSLFCNHSMMVRSMPYQDFFWEPQTDNIEYDYSILCWGPSDISSKRWDRVEPLCKFLSENDLKGIIVTQRGTKEDMITPPLEKFIKSGQIALFEGNFSGIEFHELMGKARCSIFPNTLDAFPKHIIESLLSGKPVIVSEDLLLGLTVLEKLGQQKCRIIDFDADDSNEKIMDFISTSSVDQSIRDKWLELYGFETLSKTWASVFNDKYGTGYKQLFFKNHLARIEEAKEYKP